MPAEPLFGEERPRYAGQHLLGPAGYERWRVTRDVEDWPPPPSGLAVAIACAFVLAAVTAVAILVGVYS